MRKKRTLAKILLVLSLFAFTACAALQYVGMGVTGCAAAPFVVCMMMLRGGTHYETDPSTYAEAMEYIDFSEPGNAYFPKSIEPYTVNSYSYTRYEYMDTCVEVFVDLTVDKTQFDELLTLARNTEGFLLERDAYYADGYKEIVFEDVYDDDDWYYLEQGNVGQAFIQKVIYNAETNNIVYEFFFGVDTGVYALDDMAYFKRFNINPVEYVAYTMSYDEQEKV